MNIYDVHLGAEAFNSVIPLMETDVLKTLSMLNNDWWTATIDELTNRRLACLHEYFPNMDENGYIKFDFRDNIHIEDTYISPNAFLRVGKLLHILANRAPYSTHPSYDCLYADDLFYTRDENDLFDDWRFINTMYFVIYACVNERQIPASRRRQQNLCNVCIIYMILRYILLNVGNRYAKIFNTREFNQRIKEKIEQLSFYLKKNYLPVNFKAQIEKLIRDMNSVKF
jgi:hypothetical protein